MSAHAIILAGLGLRKKAASLANIEKLIVSICTVTGLSFAEVVEKTKGKNLEIILKAAALTGEV